MKLCVIKLDDKFVVWKVNGPHPKGCVGHLPQNTPPEDWKFVQQAKDGSLYISKELKSQWIKNRIKNAIS